MEDISNGNGISKEGGIEMREIKFRALDKGKNWIYGSNKVKSRGGFSLCYESGIGEVLSLKDFFWLVESNNLWDTLSQYTGLKDKNEGDIVNATITSNQGSEFIGIGCIKYHKGKCAFQVSLKNGDKSLSCNDKVIGNIHENPEILKQK